MRQGLADPVERARAERLSRINLVAAASFVMGGSLFAMGAVLAQIGLGSLVAVNITYLIGGLFFSLGGYTSVLLVVNTSQGGRMTTETQRMRWWSYQPHQLGWRSAVVLFVGTLLFGVSLVAAFAAGLTPRQSNGWIWFPDILGCVCFLVSGHLALLDVGDGHIRVRAHRVDWWVVAVNQTGSILFFLAGLAAFTRPATSRALDIGLVNWGTFAGAICFALGGLIQAFDTPHPTRTADHNHDEAD